MLLMPCSWDILSAWDLYLNVWSILGVLLLLQLLLLARRTVKVLRSLIDNIICWANSDGQVNVLSGASSGRPCPSFRGVVSISFDTFN